MKLLWLIPNVSGESLVQLGVPQGSILGSLIITPTALSLVTLLYTSIFCKSHLF